eukprot:CAMPEP_0202479352 /NCGR_PEP_ID=MMETSP1360-20130828/94939_1 /ASSEMBLY_ACC=CAM_ASM_000848 /TAXON_ID=515479 /ORGANISM="Licmophora paradoxa, Strain CCMP2313" /LENGTH=217 /DNA_ID=CAMNT_0049106675 /DNA_START=492 /DNA_END=1142 /DNA_ORIENTATION=-
MNKTEWPVELYRHTLNGGWEKAAYDVPSNSKTTKNKCPYSVVAATPVEGGVEVHTFRLKIKVSPHDYSKNLAWVTKRRSTLLFPTRRGGQVCLKFGDVQDCNEFFDRLNQLNQAPVSPDIEEALISNDSKKSDKDSAANTDRKRKAIMREPLDLLEMKEQDEEMTKRRKHDTLSYLVRLLHDQDFCQFVDKVENTLMATPGGTKMLENFPMRDIEGE